MLDTSVFRERELARFKESGQFAPRLRELLESAGFPSPVDYLAGATWWEEAAGTPPAFGRADLTDGASAWTPFVSVTGRRLDTTKDGDFAAISLYGKLGDCAGLLAFDTSTLIDWKR